MKIDCIEAFEYTIKGIPCLIGVTYYHHQKPYRGSAYFCNSSDDYYGYTDTEFVVLDRTGHYAKWLEVKLITMIVTKLKVSFMKTCRRKIPIIK